jgi:hypothetical protein
MHMWYTRLEVHTESITYNWAENRILWYYRLKLRCYNRINRNLQAKVNLSLCLTKHPATKTHVRLYC